MNWMYLMTHNRNKYRSYEDISKSQREVLRLIIGVKNISRCMLSLPRLPREYKAERD